MLFFQALEPRALFRLGFSVINWCGDGPLYFLLFPLLYWLRSPAIALRYGYLWGFAVLVMTVLQEHAGTLRPFLATPEQVAFLQYPLAGLYWFPDRQTLMEVYRQSPSFPSGHALFATALGLYVFAHTSSTGLRWLLLFSIVMIPLARLYRGVHYPADVLACSGLGFGLFLLASGVKWEGISMSLARLGIRRWHRQVILVGLLGSGLALLSRGALVVLLVLLSYPLMLTCTGQLRQRFVTVQSPGWRTINAVGGCLGVGMIVAATAPLLSLGALMSVPLVTAWVALGCPLLIAQTTTSRRTQR